jgi:hypothetical protein
MSFKVHPSQIDKIMNDAAIDALQDVLCEAYARGVDLPDSVLQRVALNCATGLWIAIKARRQRATDQAPDDPAKPKLGTPLQLGSEPVVISDMRGELWRIDPRKGTFRKCSQEVES